MTKCRNRSGVLLVYQSNSLTFSLICSTSSGEYSSSAAVCWFMHPQAVAITSVANSDITALVIFRSSNDMVVVFAHQSVFR